MNWKAPPTDGKLWLNKSLELQLLLACNWNCHACDAFSNFSGISFVRKATMSMHQIGTFIGEMKAANAYIGRIRLLGGEPTLHPKFREIAELLQDELVKSNHVGRLEVVTNGSHPEKVQPVKSFVRVRVSDEGDKQKHHTANLIHTPNSLGYQGRICSAPWHCGFSLNYYGYFPCSSGAGIARMRDWMQWQRLTLPTCQEPCQAVKETWPDLQQLCNFCYHGLRDQDKIRCGTGMQPGEHALNTPGKEAWEALAPWLNGKQPEFAIYGQTA